MKHGYYSEKQRARVLENIESGVHTGEFSAFHYLTPTGRPVLVTCVGTEPPNFDDVQDLGPVTDWLDSVR